MLIDAATHAALPMGDERFAPRTVSLEGMGDDVPAFSWEAR